MKTKPLRYMKLFFRISYFTLFLNPIFAQINPVLPIPSPKQIAWQDLEFYGFLHFNMNTFTNVEWGEGKESPLNFNPTQLDCNQWARIAKAAGMKGLILTVKHHDGFALYPSKFTQHTIAKSPYKNGKGDILRELSEACKKYDLKLGIYLSPWDRFHPDYGTEKYNAIYVAMQKELLTNYGEIFEFWYDGANGEGPNGKKQIYDWPLFNSTAEKLMPNIIQFSDAGPDIRWVGNEQGFAYDETWSIFEKEKVFPGMPEFDLYKKGNPQGKYWVPVEVDVSIRPGWYYHPEQDQQVKSPQKLLDIYIHSVGRNGNLLLNIPVDTRGLFHPNDSAALMEFAKLRNSSFVNLLNTKTLTISPSSEFQNYTRKNLLDNDKKTFWAPLKEDSKPRLFVELNQSILANAVIIQEPIAMGQRIKSFELKIIYEDGSIEIVSGKTIGNKRIQEFKEGFVKDIELKINESRDIPLISQIELIRINRQLN